MMIILHHLVEAQFVVTFKFSFHAST